MAIVLVTSHFNVKEKKKKISEWLKRVKLNACTLAAVYVYRCEKKIYASVTIYIYIYM